MQYEDEVKMQEDLLEVELSSKKKLIEIEIENFKRTVDAIGPQTIVSMATFSSWRPQVVLSAPS